MAIVKVEKNKYTVESLYQWDKNQVLQIYGLSLASIPEIHFTNSAMDRAIVRQASMNSAGVITADIPNSLLQKPYKITAYVCIYTGETFESLYKIEIPVNARKKPGDYTIEDNDGEIYSFNAIENEIENLKVDNASFKSTITIAWNTFKSNVEKTVNTMVTKFDEAMNSFSELKTTVTNYVMEVTNHIADVANPHKVSAEQTGAVVNGVSLSEPILEKALTLSKGTYHYHFASNYSGTDLPDDNYKYGSATIYKRANASIVVILHGLTSHVVPVSNYYNGNAWSGWSTEFLPLTGGTLSGAAFNIAGGLGLMWANENLFKLESATSANSNTKRGVGVYNSNHSTIEGSIRLVDTVSGTTETYRIFGEHNKPTGTYTGNGSATSRSISINYVGRLVLITSVNGSAIVTYSSGFVSNGETITSLSGNNARLESNKLVIATTDSKINASGITYTYQIL